MADPGKPDKARTLDYTPEEHVQPVFEVQGGGPVTRWIARAVGPIIKTIIRSYVWIRYKRRRRGMRPPNSA